jgi:poly [ADP-ribose] polymerase
MDKSSDEFKRLVDYVKKTHAATHNTYNLDVEEIFTVAREGEAKRFRPFKDLHNRQLLWHGSRTTNFGGILSQGLRIAPPEAPVVCIVTDTSSFSENRIFLFSDWLHVWQGYLLC